MQSAANGTVVENGSTRNGVPSLANGCDSRGEEEVEGSRTISHKKRAQRLSQTDTDMIRLIGQHLREMGFQ